MQPHTLSWLGSHFVALYPLHVLPGWKPKLNEPTTPSDITQGEGVQALKFRDAMTYFMWADFMWAQPIKVKTTEACYIDKDTWKLGVWFKQKTSQKQVIWESIILTLMRIKSHFIFKQILEPKEQ